MYRESVPRYNSYASLRSLAISDYLWFRNATCSIVRLGMARACEVRILIGDNKRSLDGTLTHWKGMYHGFSFYLVVLDGESSGIERSSVGAGNIEQYAVILHSEIHVHVVR